MNVFQDSMNKQVGKMSQTPTIKSPTHCSGPMLDGAALWAHFGFGVRPGRGDSCRDSLLSGAGFLAMEEES